MSGVELDGQRGRTGQFGEWLPGGWPGAPRARHSPGHDGKGLGELEPREVGPETVVRAAAEGQHGRRGLASDVEPIGILIHSGIAVGRGGVGKDQRAGRNDDPAQFDVLDNGAQDTEEIGL